MSKQMTSEEKWEARVKAKSAAKLLLKEYIDRRSNEVVACLAEIIPFFEECSYYGLQDAMNTVNSTFASVSLDVIKDIYEKEEDDPDRRILPCDADKMQEAVLYLTKFIGLFAAFSHLFNQYEEPAIQMCRQAYGGSTRG